jgi:hypothetical protein
MNKGKNQEKCHACGRLPKAFSENGALRPDHRADGLAFVPFPAVGRVKVNVLPLP